MNTKVECRVANMKKQTFGVEVEMNSISRKKASEIIANYFGTISYDGSAMYGYRTYACRDRKDRIWKCSYDGSIHGEDSQRCELITPILTYEDMEDLQEIIRLLRSAGAKSSASRGCGVHIHIGADGHTPKTMRNLTNIMASHEPLLKQALALADTRINSYCKMVDKNFLTMVNKKKPTSMSNFADIWYKSQGYNLGRSDHYNHSRYHMLNFHATFTKGTIEFRLFQFDEPTRGKANGLHAGQLKSYIQLCLALSQMAKEINGASPKPQQNENPKYAMRTWLLRLGFIGEEFSTARDFLTRRLPGDAAFRKGRASA